MLTCTEQTETGIERRCGGGARSSAVDASERTWGAVDRCITAFEFLDILLLRKERFTRGVGLLMAAPVGFYYVVRRLLDLLGVGCYRASSLHELLLCV